MARQEDSTRLDDLLRQRTELDRRLARYKQEFAVMFADIAGSTSFFERRGDVSGLMMVQELVDRARRAVTPLGGQVVKSIGDAVLVRFAQPGPAVRGAVALQESFAEWNRSRARADRMRLRVGVSWGAGFVKDEDVFGDVVNLAARLEHLAEPGQIVVSAALHATAGELAGLTWRRLPDAQLKGKAAPQEVYDVAWPGAEEAAQAPAESRAFSLVLLQAEEGGVYPLALPETLLGRTEGEIRFPGDGLLSARHARFLVDADGVRIEDVSASGVYLRLREPVQLRQGDQVVVGRKLFEFIEGTGEPQLHFGHQRFPLRPGETLIGRREGDIIFPDDAFLSGLHARLLVDPEGVVLEDLRSTNGTFLKVRGTARLEDGDQVLCGSKLLLVRAN